MILESQRPLFTKEHRGFFLLWFAVFAFKVFVSTMVPLVPDEAYYWVWSKKLSFSYFDHPPMIAWWIYIADFLHLSGTWVRLPALILAHFTPFVWFLLIQKSFPEIKDSWSVTYFLFPITGLGSIFLTPDLPMALFWAISSYFLFSYYQQKSKVSALLFGVALGFGFLSKYLMILLPMSLILLLFKRSFRKSALNKDLFLVIIAGALISIPVLLWNWQNDWVSFKFQLQHGFQGTLNPLKEVLIYVGACLIILVPFISKKIWHKPLEDRYVILLISSLFPFIFFLFSSFRSHVEFNWPLIAMPGIFIFAHRFLSKMRLFLIQLFYGLVSCLFCFAVVFPQISKVPMLVQVAEYKNQYKNISGYSPIFFSSYQMASILWHESNEPKFKLKGSRRFDMYDFWPESNPTTNQFYFLHEKSDRWSDSFLSWKKELIFENEIFDFWQLRRP